MQHADPERFREWVVYLAGEIGRRPATRPDLLKKVADRLTEYFRQLGYRVSSQSVPSRRTSVANIIAAPPGPEDPYRPLLIIGAHYDSVSRSPGADDNGSGIAGLMELARLLAPDIPASIRLAAFCPEEPPAFRTRNMGSYVYAGSLKENNVAVKGMICLEMIGYFDDRPGSQTYPLPFMNRIYPDRGNFIAIVGNLRSSGWCRQVRNGFTGGTDLPVETLNAPGILVGIDFSDHWSFNKFGYPAVMVTDTAFYRNPHYHRPSDTPDTLDYRRASMVVDGLAAAVRKLG